MGYNKFLTSCFQGKCCSVSVGVFLAVLALFQHAFSKVLVLIKSTYQNKQVACEGYIRSQGGFHSLTCS